MEVREMSVLEYLEELLEPYNHEITFKPPNYWIILENQALAIGWRDLITFEEPTYDIHHTEECLEAQEAFYAFKNMIEDFGGYMPVKGTCDCPRDTIPPDPKGKAKMMFEIILHKYQSSKESVING